MVSLRSAKFTSASEMVIDVETEKDASADSPTSVLNEEVHPSQCSYLAHELIVWYQGQEAPMLLPFSYAVVSGAIGSCSVLFAKSLLWSNILCYRLCLHLASWIAQCFHYEESLYWKA
ncbi:PREDICTED: probable magnesium transporter NIPA8 isoform X2 [Camelina sativa]|nr:PREDICTED: probable magnesium transporter NIPA8 isoform X2 [Camelina sativa]